MSLAGVEKNQSSVEIRLEFIIWPGQRGREQINMHKRSIGEIKLLHRGHTHTHHAKLCTHKLQTCSLHIAGKMPARSFPPSAIALIPLLSFPFRCKSHGGNECFAHDLLLNSIGGGRGGRGRRGRGKEKGEGARGAENLHLREK